MRYHRNEQFGESTRQGQQFAEAARAVAVSSVGLWYLAGDQEIHALATTGELVTRWPTSLPAWSLAIDLEGRVWAGEQGQIEVFAPDGDLLDSWQNEKLFGLVTSLAVADDVFVADARTRWIHRFDQSRELLNHIGDRHRKGGFHIPNGVLDFALDRDGTLVVANPGMHRVERYRADGEKLGHFGRFGQHDPTGFPGCCNPTNLALGPDGEIVVSEKAGPRVKIYEPEGGLMSVVAGYEDFDPACKNMDLAVTDKGLIGVVDTVQRVLAVYAPTDLVARVPTGAVS